MSLGKDSVHEAAHTCMRPINAAAVKKKLLLKRVFDLICRTSVTERKRLNKPSAVAKEARIRIAQLRIIGGRAHTYR